MARGFEMDMHIISPSDYTIMVEGLDSTYDEEALKEFFENYGRRDNKKAEVVKVLPLYNVGDYIAKERELQKLQTQKFLLE